jgi:hypothetical protein
MVQPLVIQAVDAPPERYADRITAEMLRHLVAQSAHIRATVREIVLATADDGGPRGQERMRKRIDAAGTTLGHSNVRTLLKPGKRGKYEIRFIFWTGWDRDREAEIKVGDPIPERPQIMHWCAKLKGTGRARCRFSCVPLLIISHHVLSRTAQRHGLRTLDDMFDAIETLNQWVIKFFRYMDTGVDSSLPQAPLEGWRVPINSRSWVTEEPDAQLVILTESYFVNQLLLRIKDLPRLTSAED